MKKIIIVFFLIIYILNLFSVYSLAGLGLDKATSALNGDFHGEDFAENVAVKATEYAIGTLRTIAYGIATIILLWLGIKYMSSSPSGKADVIKSAVPFLIGALVLYGTGTILGIIKGWAS